MAISLPAAFRNAFVQRIFRGFFFALKPLWHLDRQKRNIYSQPSERQGGGV